jgi:hypothetical protein
MIRTRQEHQKDMTYRNLSLRERMSGQYWRLARRHRRLLATFELFRDRISIRPAECSEAMSFLKALRRSAQQAAIFYRSLDQENAKYIEPSGTVTKLGELDHQVTELLLHLDVFLTAIIWEQTAVRIYTHLLIRQLFSKVLTTFEDVSSQLKALLAKDQERRAVG